MAGNDEKEHRIQGFMVAIGLLLENSNAQTIFSILAVVNSFGQNLGVEIEKDSYIETAVEAGVSPCDPGWHWNPECLCCEPDKP